MFTTIRIFLAAATLLAASAASADVADERAPELGEQDCRTLLALYGALEDGDAVQATRDALARAILARPGCGEMQGSLLDARPSRGVNPFDEREPGGFGPPDMGGEQ